MKIRNIEISDLGICSKILEKEYSKKPYFEEFEGKNSLKYLESKFLKRNLRRKYFFLKNINSITNLEKDEEKKSPGRKKTTKSNIEFGLSVEIQKIIGTIKLLSDELLNLVKLEENDKTKNVEENLARTINYMSNVLYNQLKKEVINFKEAKFNEFATYIQAEKILLDNIDELRENMYTYTYKIKRKLREFKE